MRWSARSINKSICAAGVEHLRFFSQIGGKTLDLAVVYSYSSLSFGGYEILLYFCLSCANVCT